MTPQLPFPRYKWKWLSVLPTEGLLDPPVYLGVLRALAACEGERTSSDRLKAELAKVRVDTGTTVALDRVEKDRNLIRNSGQYWKGTGLLLKTPGIIHLSPLGKEVATGRITQSEFAALMVEKIQLPNPWTYAQDQIGDWERVGLKIYPFRLILDVLDALNEVSGTADRRGFITPQELYRVLIPLAGTRAEPQEIASAICQFRETPSLFIDWPNCTPRPNDARMAREFLLFLLNFGICGRHDGNTNDEEQYFLHQTIMESGFQETSDASVYGDLAHQSQILEDAKSSPLSTDIARGRIAREVLERPQQRRFRARILSNCSNTCLISGETVPEVLEAAHLRPISMGGTDQPNNGICLRVDIHRLFDFGHLRLKASGKILLADQVRQSVNYATLPSQIVVPEYVDTNLLLWRERYT